MKNMSVADLRYLSETGHTIGAHTATHQRLSFVRDDERLVDEIVASADWLEERLKVRIDHFAFPFGNLASFSRAALQVARSRFQHIYTGMRGDNAESVPSWAIRRDAITVDDSLHLVGAFLEGAADPRYARDLRTYESWAQT